MNIEAMVAQARRSARDYFLSHDCFPARVYFPIGIDAYYGLLDYLRAHCVFYNSATVDTLKGERKGIQVFDMFFLPFADAPMNGIGEMTRFGGESI